MAGNKIAQTGSVLDEAAVRELMADMHGTVLRPGDRDFERARTVWNGMIDRTPALIARCADAADVGRAVHFARASGLVVAVRGGGHNIAGHAVCDGGIVIDLSPLRTVEVDPAARVVRAQGGVTWGDFDRATQAFGLATTGGLISTTGIAGLTLGGGLGWLMRRHGLACDNLLSADVVSAEGQLLTASADENCDLFWGLRGGGGNFGVVTSFTYRLHPVGPVLAGLVAYPLARARDVLRFYREYTATAPDELTAYATLLSGPDGAPLVAILVCYSGPITAGEEVVRPLRTLGSPLQDTIGPLAYTELQRAYDAGSPPGLRNYWKSSFLKDLSDEAIDTLVAGFTAVPSPRSNVLIEHLGGAVRRVPEDETAFAPRDAEYDCLIASVWEDAVDDERNVSWARTYFGTMAPFMRQSAYVNYLGSDGEGRMPAADDGARYKRLVALKTRYDPTNLFHLNQNVAPAPAGDGPARQ